MAAMPDGREGHKGRYKGRRPGAGGHGEQARGRFLRAIALRGQGATKLGLVCCERWIGAGEERMERG